MLLSTLLQAQIALERSYNEKKMRVLIYRKFARNSDYCLIFACSYLIRISSANGSVATGKECADSVVLGVLREL